MGLSDFSAFTMFEDEGDSASDSTDEDIGRSDERDRNKEAAAAAAAALASALMAKGDRICSGYCGSEIGGVPGGGESWSLVAWSIKWFL